MSLHQSLTALFLAVTLLASPVSAENPPYAVVDLQKVLQESIAGRAARNALESDAKKGRAEIEVRQREVEKLRREFEAQRGVLSGQALEERRADLERKEKEVSRSVEDAREALARKNQEYLKKLIGEVNEVLGEFAKEQNYQFVIENDRRLVLYAAPALDVTAKVIAEMDRRKVSFE